MTVADENRRIKARAIALHLWRHGMTSAELEDLPFASRRRTDPTMTRFAREALAASPRPEAREKDPPHGRESDTWRIAADKLTEIDRMAAAGEPVPDRDLLRERHRWILDDETTGPADVLPPAPTAATTLVAVPDGGFPRGWLDLAALGPLEHDWCIHHPDRRPIVITPDGGRCADCPPRPDEVDSPFGGKRDGWGRLLNWAPKPDRSCPPARCYCGRCPAATLERPANPGRAA